MTLDPSEAAIVLEALQLWVDDQEDEMAVLGTDRQCVAEMRLARQLIERLRQDLERDGSS